MAHPEFSTAKACVFDAYGTLFDVHSAVGRGGKALGDKAAAVSELWRLKQLEYTWLRAITGAHVDFWQVTGDALDYALETHGLPPDRHGLCLRPRESSPKPGSRLCGNRLCGIRL